MGEFLLAVVVILVALVAFAAWLCVKVIGLIIRAFAGPTAPRQHRAPAGPVPPPVPWRSEPVSCPQPRCRAVNVPHARFCRRCGKAVSAAAAGGGKSGPAPMRYVA